MHLRRRTDIYNLINLFTIHRISTRENFKLIFRQNIIIQMSKSSINRRYAWTLLQEMVVVQLCLVRLLLWRPTSDQVHALVNRHQRCRYSDLPFSRIHYFYISGSRNGLEAVDIAKHRHKKLKLRRQSTFYHFVAALQT